jgi:hypothetical protein
LCSKALLAPPQKLPPEALTNTLEAAIQAWEGRQPEIAHTQLKQAMELAQEMGYL